MRSQISIPVTLALLLIVCIAVVRAGEHPAPAMMRRVRWYIDPSNVSGVASDTNDCSRERPCSTFSRVAALRRLDVKLEINVMSDMH